MIIEKGPTGQPVVQLTQADALELIQRLANATADADVVGTHLDNAMGDGPPPHNCGEFLVKITLVEHTDTIDIAKHEYFNLASLIALARRAKL